MKHDLTTEAKRVILNWLRGGYYDPDELLSVSPYGTDTMSVEEIENEIIRLSKTDPEFTARIAENCFCQGCSLVEQYHKRNYHGKD